MNDKELMLYVIKNSLIENSKNYNLKGDDYNSLVAERWETLMIELNAQAITVLPFSYIRKTSAISDGDMLAYKRIWVQNITNVYGMSKEQEVLTNILEESGIPTVVLKGTAASVYYPLPELRIMGDIDILVRPEDFERAFQILQETGYINKEKMNADKRHNEFEKNGIEIELHNRFATRQNNKQRNYLDQLIWNGMDQRIYKEIMGIKFPMLPHWINGLVLLSHIDYHMDEGPGLRHLIDWMMFVQENLDDKMWVKCFEKAAQQMGMKKLAIVLTKTCQLYLGLTDTITWCESADVEICKNVLEYIIGHGSFGVKDSQNRKRGDILLLLKTPGNYIRYAQRIGCRTWKISQKYPFLQKVAWIYQSFRFMVHDRNDCTDWKNYIKDYRDAQRKRELFKQLDISR